MTYLFYSQSVVVDWNTSCEERSEVQNLDFAGGSGILQTPLSAPLRFTDSKIEILHSGLCVNQMLSKH